MFSLKAAPFVSALRGVQRARGMSLLADFDPLKLTVTKTKTPGKLTIPTDKLGFGLYFTDHMLTAKWSNKTGWAAPEILPYGNLSIPPSASVFHYAIECFEGMKAFHGQDGKLRLFRPDKNAERFKFSCSRLSLPTIEVEPFVKMIETIVDLDRAYTPHEVGCSLYIRPVMIATQPIIGVMPASEAMFFVILSPVAKYFQGRVDLLADTQYVRAWPGGMGSTKCGGNYAATVKPQRDAFQTSNCTQLLWLFGPEEQITEAGTMNFFVLWTNENGEKELITAPLDGTILPGVVRASVLDLAREWNEFKVSERVFTMPQLKKAIDEKRVVDMFGCGTAATISPVHSILYKGEKCSLNQPFEGGPFAARLRKALFDIQYGVVPSHPWAPVVPHFKH